MSTEYVGEEAAAEMKGAVRGGVDSCAAEPPELSAVMPCLNEARTLGTCIDKALESFRRLGVRGEVIVADNGSTDGSRKIALEHGARVVEQPIKGYGAALNAGIEAASGKYLIMGDADDSYDWSNLDPFLQALRDGNDLVMGNRFKGGIAPGAMPWHHRHIGNPLLSFAARIVFRVPIRDFHCGMRGFTKDAYKAMRPDTTGMEFATEMIANAARSGVRIVEVPTKLYRDGRDRPPHLRSFRDGWRHLRFILTYAPDHLYLIPGLVMLMLGAVMQTLLASGPVTVFGYYFGIHYLALGGLLSLVGFNVLSMGIQCKVLISMRYPKIYTATVDWFARQFRLEHGLLLALVLCMTGIAVLFHILSTWMEHPGKDMTSTVHPVFAATQALALGANVAFSSFMLQLLRVHHSSGGDG